MTLGTIGRLIRAILLGVVLAVLLFPLLGWIGSSIPRNGPDTPASEGVTIMVESNGTHTGIIMPVVTSVKDWREVFPSAGQPRADGYFPTHISVGWGEREIFMNVPTWGDLTAATATRIAVFGGEPVMRVSHYVRPAPGPDHRPLVLTEEDYARMVTAIEDSLAPPAPDGIRERLTGVNPEDAYYDARGHYTLAETCNSWVGNMLAKGGVQMGWWTPFAGGVMKWIDQPEEA